jgi:long-chain acyl-CoA synthetase
MAEPPAAVVRLLLWPLLERLVAGAVLRAFGGRVRFAISGGAPLSERSSRFLVGLGLPLAEGYGLTEAGPVVTATTLEDSRPGSVGRPLGGVEIRLGASDELLIRSPGLMQGYWRDPERSAAAIDGDGWLHTGDIAECRDGRLYITGRLKGLIVLSTGKKLPSAEVEAAIEADPLFEQCCAIGDTRPFVVAIVVLNGEQWAAFATRNGLEAGSPETPAASEALLARIATAMEDQPAFAQVRGVHAQLDPWTVEDGILTPTLKIKRQVIEERYGAVIDALYAQRASQRSADPRP